MGVREWEDNGTVRRDGVWRLWTGQWVDRAVGPSTYQSSLEGAMRALLEFSASWVGIPPVVGTDVQEATPAGPSPSPPTLGLPVQFDPS